MSLCLVVYHILNNNNNYFQGGREHGVPILVSVIHPDTPASRSNQLFVGDAILSVNGHNLREVFTLIINLLMFKLRIKI